MSRQTDTTRIRAATAALAQGWNADTITLRALDMFSPDVHPMIAAAMARPDVQAMMVISTSNNDDGRVTSDPRWDKVANIDLHRDGTTLRAYITIERPWPEYAFIALGTMTLMPALPETLMLALPGRPATVVIDHLLLAGIVIESTDTTTNGTIIRFTIEDPSRPRAPRFSREGGVA